MSFINKTVSGAGSNLPSAGSGSANSVNGNINALRDEVNSLIGEFKDAAQDKFPEFQSRLKKIAGSVEDGGARLVDKAMTKSHQLSDRAQQNLKEACGATEDFIAAHPWKTVTVVAAATLAASILLNRKH